MSQLNGTMPALLFDEFLLRVVVGVNIGVVVCGTPSRRNPCPTTDVVAEYGTEALLDAVDNAPREAAPEALAAVLALLVVEVDEVHDPVWLPLFCAMARGEMETAIAIA